MATVEDTGHTLSLPHTGDLPGLNPSLPGLARVDAGRDERSGGELENVEIERTGGGGGGGEVRRLECEEAAAGVWSGHAVHVSAGVEVPEAARFVALAGAHAGLGGLVGAEHVGRAVRDEVALAEFLPLLFTRDWRGEFLPGGGAGGTSRSLRAVVNLSRAVEFLPAVRDSQTAAPAGPSDPDLLHLLVGPQLADALLPGAHPLLLLEHEEGDGNGEEDEEEG